MLSSIRSMQIGVLNISNPAIPFKTVTLIKFVSKLYVSFQVFYIAFVDLVVRVDYTDALASTFAPV
jgi:hypothetical protein